MKGRRGKRGEDPRHPGTEARDRETAPETAPGEPAETEGAVPQEEQVSVSRARLEALERKAEERDRFFQELQRRAADFDNYRKRVIREREGWQFTGLQRFLRDLLPVVDDLRRAVISAEEEDRDPRHVLEGLRLIEGQIEKLLAQYGVEPIPAEGERFDPEIHEAMRVQETADVPDGTVVEEFRRGYRFRDAVLRAAQVTVSRSPEGPAREEGAA